MIPNYVIKCICDHMPHLRFMAQRKQWQSLARSYLALGSNLTPLDTMKLAHVAEGQGWTPGPHCNECGLHIGESERGTCGACNNPSSLSRAEWRSLRKLIRKHWASGGREFDLFRDKDYRPYFYIRPAQSVQKAQSPLREQLLQEGRERGELADLYDRVQAQRTGTERTKRACRG